MFASNTMYERYTPEPHNAGRDIQSVVGILNFISWSKFVNKNQIGRI